MIPRIQTLDAGVAKSLTGFFFDLKKNAVDRICGIFHKHGASCKVSSIHVNGWFGNYDKLGMTRIFVRERWGMDLDAVKERFFFCGDSPNDEPMFRYFPYTAGVKNVLRFKKRLIQLPRFIAGQDGGEGFIEIADALLKGRKER